MTPQPTNEVVREGDEGENEQIQDKEVPPQPTLEMIKQVLLARYLIRARHLQCFLYQYLRFREYNMQLLWLPAWMHHWKYSHFLD